VLARRLQQVALPLPVDSLDRLLQRAGLPTSLVRRRHLRLVVACLEVVLQLLRVPHRICSAQLQHKVLQLVGPHPACSAQQLLHLLQVQLLSSVVEQQQVVVFLAQNLPPLHQLVAVSSAKLRLNLRVACSVNKLPNNHRVACSAKPLPSSHPVVSSANPPPSNHLAVCLARPPHNNLPAASLARLQALQPCLHPVLVSLAAARRHRLLRDLQRRTVQAARTYSNS